MSSEDCKPDRKVSMKKIFQPDRLVFGLFSKKIRFSKKLARHLLNAEVQSETLRDL